METNLLNLYKQARSRPFCYNDSRAKESLERARAMLARGEKEYCGSWPWARGAPNVTRQTKERASDNYAWIENTDSAGLRFVGYADEIVRGRAIDHKGWFTNEFAYETYRGAVWQLPGRKGVARFIAGYQDPNNADAAFVDLDIIFNESEYMLRRLDHGGPVYATQENANEQAKKDAAFRADSIAQRNAEREWEYNEGWQAGARWADLAEQISTTRQETLDLLSEMKVERKAREATAPEICATLRNAVARALRDIEKMREERAELFDNYGHSDGFADHLPRA
jgi:hypothetical protein